MICSMVEESENMEAENVTDYAQTLREEMSTKIRIEVLHGKMKPAQKMRSWSDLSLERLMFWYLRR